MAPLPVNNTQRYILDYTVAGHKHSLLMRCDPEVDDAQASAAIGAFLTAIGGWLYPFNVVGFRYIQAGHDVSVPAVWTGTAPPGSGSPQPKDTAAYADFIGRDTDGVRVRVAVFGINIPVSNGDFRLNVSESTAAADAIDALKADPQCFWTVGGKVPIWHQYADTGYNAYWRNKLR